MNSSSGPLSKLISFLVAAGAMGSCWLAEIRFFDVNHTYFWLPITAMTTILVCGGLLARLRVIPLTTLLFLGGWLGGIALPPTTQYPIVRQADGIRCELKSAREFDIQTLDGSDLERKANVDGAEVTASIGPAIQVSTIPRRVFTWDSSMVHRGDRSYEALSPMIQKPGWSRSMGLQVAVQRWPKTPACELKIPLDNSQQDSYRVSGDGYELTVSHPQWEDPQHLGISLSINYSRFSNPNSTGAFAPPEGDPPSRMTGKEFLITDELGNYLPVMNRGEISDVNGLNYFAIIDPLFRMDSRIPAPKWIKIQLFSQQDLAKYRTVFDFGRIP